MKSLQLAIKGQTLIERIARSSISITIITLSIVLTFINLTVISAFIENSFQKEPNEIRKIYPKEDIIYYLNTIEENTDIVDKSHYVLEDNPNFAPTMLPMLFKFGSECNFKTYKHSLDNMPGDLKRDILLIQNLTGNFCESIKNSSEIGIEMLNSDIGIPTDLQIEGMGYYNHKAYTQMETLLYIIEGIKAKLAEDIVYEN